MLDTFYQWYGQLDPHLRIYWSVALITSALFAVQTALTFIGLGHGDVDVDFQAADATPDGGLEGVDGAMQIFTVRNVINFLLGVWSCVSITFLVSMIQNIVSERKREKRDLEYHEARMKEYNK